MKTDETGFGPGRWFHPEAKPVSPPISPDLSRDLHRFQVSGISVRTQSAPDSRALTTPQHPNSPPAIHTGNMTPRPVLVDLYAAQAATGIKPAKLRVWLHRRRLTHHGYDRHGRALIDLTELQTLQQPAAA